MWALIKKNVREVPCLEQMLLLYESEKAASALVQSVIHALPMRTVGFRLLPYAIAGSPGAIDPLSCLRRSRAERRALHPAPEPEKIVSIDAVWAELAAPALLRCLPRRAPILLDHHGPTLGRFPPLRRR